MFAMKAKLGKIAKIANDEKKQRIQKMQRIQTKLENGTRRAQIPRKPLSIIVSRR